MMIILLIGNYTLTTQRCGKVTLSARINTPSQSDHEGPAAFASFATERIADSASEKKA